jgi:ribonuclease E
MGFIIRTAGMGRTKTALARDLEYLLKLWQSIETNVAEQPAPALLFKEQDVVIRSIRDHFSPDIAEIFVDEPTVYKKVRGFFQQIMPRHEKLVKLYGEKRPLFNKYQLEEQVEMVYRKRINLKSGGYILIEPTEAMVAIDVNSGSATMEKGIEETAFRVNMEAAPEIARQLRLRDLGGIIVIDFIDMGNKKHDREVEKAIKAVLKEDRAKTKVLRISPLGVLELSRQRLKSSLGTGEYLHCPMCDGRGKIRSPDMSALSVFRKMKSLAIKSGVSEVRASVPTKVGEYLLNNMRSLLVQMEQEYNIKISVHSAERLCESEIMVEAVKQEPPEQILAEPDSSRTAPPEEVPAAEEEVQAEPEKKKSRRPSRRRRRPKRRSVVEAGEAASPAILEEGPAVEKEEREKPAVHGQAYDNAQQEPVTRPGPENGPVVEAEENRGDSKRKRSWIRSYLPFL